jgi:hypothetical protein
MSLRVFAAAGVVVTALAGCAAAQPSSHPAPPPVGAAIRAAGVAGVRNGHAVVYAVVGSRWATVPLPHQPAAGASVTGHGASIYAAQVDAGGVTLDSTHDGGRSWQQRQVATTPDVAGVSLALSADGSKLAMLLDRSTSAGVAGQASVLVGPATAGALAAHPAPAAGQVAWWHGRLALSGGVLSSRLYLGDATASSWRPVPVSGQGLAPLRNVDPTTPSIGTPATLPDGALLVPVTSHAGPPSVDLLATANGRVFRSLGRVALTGELGGGTSSPVSVVPGADIVVSDPNTLRFTVVSSSGKRTFTPKGLPAPPSTLSFETPQLGLAEVDTASCAQGKTGCTVKTEVYATSDGGGTWQSAP